MNPKLKNIFECVCGIMPRVFCLNSGFPDSLPDVSSRMDAQITSAHAYVCKGTLNQKSLPKIDTVDVSMHTVVTTDTLGHAENGQREQNSNSLYTFFFKGEKELTQWDV